MVPLGARKVGEGIEGRLRAPSQGITRAGCVLYNKCSQLSR